MGWVSRPVQSVERAAAVLRLLATGRDGVALGEVAGSLGLAKPTVHGLLRTLVDVGFVDQDGATGRYRLLPDALGTSDVRVDANELRARALNWADPLAARTGQEVRVGVLDGAVVRVVHHVFRPDDTAQTLRTGQLLPAHATALGKVLLAFDAHAGAAAGGQDHDLLTPRTLWRGRVLARCLGEVRVIGWALAASEHRMGEASIAAPIRGHGGLVVGAIGVSGEQDRLCTSAGRARQTLVDQVRRAAVSVGADLAQNRREAQSRR